MATRGGCRWGGRDLGRNDLQHEADHWRSIGQAIEPGGALFVYGCRVAAGESGHDFVDSLFEVSQVPVRAASGPIGSSLWGGSWELDVQRGASSTRPMVLEAYGGLLAR